MLSSQSKEITSRQVDKYDGQKIFIQNVVAYELSNYLGGGASGAVYQASNPNSNSNRELAVKILSPIGYKTWPVTMVTNKCVLVQKGVSLSEQQLSGIVPLTVENVWWLYNIAMKAVVGAYEDPLRGGQLRELTLTRCVEIWGFNPFGEQDCELDQETINLRSDTVIVEGMSIQLPRIPHKYVKWLRTREMICREMKNMMLVGGHPNVIELYEVLELIQDTKTTLFLVLDLASGGMLFERMKSSISPNSSCEDFARKYFVQLVSGLDYCHAKGVVHRDLKPENLLLSDSSDSAILKIADFGFSAVIFASQPVTDSSECHNKNFSQHYRPDNDFHVDFQSQRGHESRQNKVVNSRDDVSDINDPFPMRRLKSVVGSPHYIAPEVSSNEPCGYDGRKVDMWSAGVILYSLLTGSLPFSNDIKHCPRFKRFKQWLSLDCNACQKDGKICKLPSWFAPPHFSPAICSLLLRLIHPDPRMRLSASQALQHPWSSNHQCISDDLLLPYNVVTVDPISETKVSIGTVVNPPQATTINLSVALVGLRTPSSTATSDSNCATDISSACNQRDRVTKGKEKDSRNIYPAPIGSLSSNLTSKLNSLAQHNALTNITTSDGSQIEHPLDMATLSMKVSQTSSVDNFNMSLSRNNSKVDSERQLSPNNSISAQGLIEITSQERKEQEYFSRMISLSLTPAGSSVNGEDTNATPTVRIGEESRCQSPSRRVLAFENSVDTCSRLA